jgi:hypothetical protein
VGLPPEQAQAARALAVENAGPAKITANLVKAAVQKVGPAGERRPPKRKARRSGSAKRRLVEQSIGQLLVLLSEKADQRRLKRQVRAIHGHIQGLSAKGN